ncbi:DUF4434 domain-containing protein [Planctomycetota bacterium]|nr:DUF4434 domain-containing protein [Planctomycetota bacterium]
MNTRKLLIISLLTTFTFFLTNITSAQVPSSPHLTGMFIQLNNSSASKNQAWWNDRFTELNTIDIKLIIIQFTGRETVTYYPSRIQGMSHNSNDTLSLIFNAAEKHNIQLILGMPTFGEVSPTKHFDSKLMQQKSKAALDELFILYHDSPSLYGWYFPQELSDYTCFSRQEVSNQIIDFLANMTDYAHSKTNKPVMISPYFSMHVDISAYAKWWDEVALPKIDLDILAIQDGVGTKRNTIAQAKQVFEAFKPVTTKHNTQLWANVECFEQVDGWPINDKPFKAIPAQIDRFTKQINALKHTTNQFISFEFLTYMNPNRNEQSKSLYTNYSNRISKPNTQKVNTTN